MYNFQIEKIEKQDENAINYAHYLQTDFWAEFKCLHGWDKILLKVRAENQKNSEKLDFCISILTRKIAKFFCLAYIPMGPCISKICGVDFVLPISTDDYLFLLEDISKQLKSFLPKNTIFLRFDPPIDFDSPLERDNFVKTMFFDKNCVHKMLHKSVSDIQPPDTTILDLTQSEESLLAKMKSKWRYNIHLAEKKGVVVQKGSSNDIDIFYNLYLETSRRDGISIHSKKYYEDLLLLSEKSALDDAKKNPLVTLYIARHENDVLAAIITLFTPYQATYVYGASCNIKRNLMPSYLLQWTAIRDAKNFGSKTYDFYGMPPKDDESHPMYGLYRFKTGFSGKNKHRVGSIDVATSFLYKPYQFAEKLRNFWYKKVKKTLAGR